MMIELLVGLSGPTYSLDPGDRQDFPQSEAIRLIEAGYALPVAECQMERPRVEPVVEKRDTSERFVHRKNKKSRR